MVERLKILMPYKNTGRGSGTRPTIYKYGIAGKQWYLGLQISICPIYVP